MAKSMDSLWDIFRACDTDGSGYIGKEEVTSICDKFGISNIDANNIFIDLDRDGDGQISFEDFREGFKDYEKCVKESVDPSSADEISETNLPEKSAYLQIVNKARQSSNLRRVRSFTRKIDRALADDSMDPEKQSKMIEELMENLGKLKTENEMLAKSFMRERREHEEHLQQIEQDVDSQVREVEERYKERAKQEIEAERRSLRELMKEEMDQLQSQLSMFEKVENWLKSNQMNMENEKLGEFRSKLEEALHENRQMRLSLLDTQTTVAMMRSELSQLKNMYEQKCQELSAERERVLEVVNNQDFMARQLMFLQTEVNDRLQQGSENLIRSSPPISLEESKHIISARAKEKKGSIVGDYLKTNSTHSNDHNHGNILEVPSIKEDDFLSVPSVREGAKSEASSDCGYSSRRHDDDNDGLSTMTRDDHDDSNYSSNASERHNSNSDDHMGSRKESEDVNSNWIPGIEESTGPPETLYNLIFIGDMSVGKSTLIYKIVKNKFVTNLCSTVGVDFHMKTLRVDKKTIAVQLWDTGGQERFRSITTSYFRKADGVLILYDVTNERSFINVRNWMSQISEYNGRNIPVVLIGNKVDIRGKAANSVEYDRGKKLADEFDCPFFETSVKEGRNVFLAFGAIVRKMMEIDRGPPRVNEVELEKKPVDIKKKKCCSDK
ncbi:ras and EF-hand domain-containing protein-like isoform X2 [Brevipalpus obovatus]|uniref:ras and EF-hand domain-containing protein-like isoform X2 n=1 Tax=Brevipalpus obovatus TaxID=246614 RepID=UPI003D9F8A5F